MAGVDEKRQAPENAKQYVREAKSGLAKTEKLRGGRVREQGRGKADVSVHYGTKRFYVASLWAMDESDTEDGP